MALKLISKAENSYCITIAKEMEVVHVAFSILEYAKNAPQGSGRWIVT